MSRQETPPAERQKSSLREQLAALESEYASRREGLVQAIERENEEARALAQSDIFLEKDPVAQNAARSGRTETGEEVSDLKGFLLERRQWIKENPDLMTSGPRRAEDVPRDTRADDPDIWKRGTGK